MKRLLKSGIGAICAVAMAATGLGAVANSAYAAGTTSTITIQNAKSDDQFVAYRLLDLGNDGKVDASNKYVYELSSSDNENAYTAAMLSAGGLTASTATDDTTKNSENLATITDYVQYKLEDNIELTSAKDTRLRTYGNSVYALIADLDPDIAAASGVFTDADGDDPSTFVFEDIPVGYYLIV